jgi:hypothetical protein
MKTKEQILSKFTGQIRAENKDIVFRINTPFSIATSIVKVALFWIITGWLGYTVIYFVSLALVTTYLVTKVEMLDKKYTLSVSKKEGL